MEFGLTDQLLIVIANPSKRDEAICILIQVRSYKKAFLAMTDHIACGDTACRVPAGQSLGAFFSIVK
jgi:hypothetical protein